MTSTAPLNSLKNLSKPRGKVNAFPLPDFGTIQRKSTFDSSSYIAALSKMDLEVLEEASHWLTFQEVGNSQLTPAGKVNILLLALWLVVDTRTHVRFRFESSKGKNGNKSSSAIRLLDRFQWLDTYARERITTADLETAVLYIKPMKRIFTSHKRLGNALALTLYGCMAHQWQVAFICFSAAMEGILTYKKGFGITKRLGKSYACLLEAGKRKRDSAYRIFVKTYDVRSDIMHGRAYTYRKSRSNLSKLYKASRLLRNLWKKVLASESITQALEGNDNSRMQLFSTLERGYVSPQN